MSHAHHAHGSRAHGGHAHGGHAHGGRDADRRALTAALALIVVFMVAEVVAAMIASSLALLSDAAHMLTDAAALALSLLGWHRALLPGR